MRGSRLLQPSAVGDIASTLICGGVGTGLSLLFLAPTRRPQVKSCSATIGPLPRPAGRDSGVCEIRFGVAGESQSSILVDPFSELHHCSGSEQPGCCKNSPVRTLADIVEVFATNRLILRTAPRRHEEFQNARMAEFQEAIDCALQSGSAHFRHTSGFEMSAKVTCCP